MGERQKQEAIAKLSHLVRKHGVEHIAIGNGTASRETEQMAVELIPQTGGRRELYDRQRGGASVYSASKLAAEEFPRVRREPAQRRVHRPAAPGPPGGAGEDRPQGHRRGPVPARHAPGPAGRGPGRRGGGLRQRGGRGCEHRLPPLLQRVSGLTAATAKNIVKYREENGAFTTRKQVLKVPKLGPKAFEQCAGFLRVPESASVLDNTGVHPESYAAAEALLRVRLHPVRRQGQGPWGPEGEGGGHRAGRLAGPGVRRGRPHPAGHH